jgi:DNA-binding transcriptional ArsR family regulator
VNEKALVRLNSMRQVRALSDPLRLSLMAAFAAPKTTKQVADALGLPPTRLYHHVLELENAGLLELVRTSQKRGTQEKYYRSIGTRFAIDPAVFEGAAPDAALAQYRTVIGPALETAGNEILESLRMSSSGVPASADRQELPLLLSQLALTVPRARLKALIEQLERWVADARETSQDDDVVSYGALLLLYPRSDHKPTTTI